MSDNDCLLTVLVPTFNRLGYLKKLLGVLVPFARENRSIELIVSNNASSDGTREYLDSLEVNAPNIRINHMPVNIGANFHGGWLMGQISGKYYWPVGDDDYVEPELLVEVLDILRANPGIGWIHAPFEMRTASGGAHYRSACPQAPKRVERGQELFEEYSIWASFMASNIIRTAPAQAMVPKLNPGNAYFQLFLVLETSRGAPAVVLDKYKIVGGIEVTWGADAARILCGDFTRTLFSISEISNSSKTRAVLNAFQFFPKIRFLQFPFYSPLIFINCLVSHPVMFVETLGVSFVKMFAKAGRRLFPGSSR